MSCSAIGTTGSTIDAHMAFDEIAAGPPAAPLRDSVVGLAQVICALDPAMFECADTDHVAVLERYNRNAAFHIAEAVRYRRVLGSIASMADLWLSDLPSADYSHTHLTNLRTFAGNLLASFTTDSGAIDPLPITHPDFHTEWLAAGQAVLDILESPTHLAKVRAFESDTAIDAGARTFWMGRYGEALFKASSALAGSRQNLVIGALLTRALGPLGFAPGDGGAPPTPTSLLDGFVSMVQLGANIAGTGGILVGFLHIACLWQIHLTGGGTSASGVLRTNLRDALELLSAHDDALRDFEEALDAGDHDAASRAFEDIEPGPLATSIGAFVNVYQAIHAFATQTEPLDLTSAVALLSSTFSAVHSTVEAVHAWGSALLLPARIIGPETLAVAEARAFARVSGEFISTFGDCAGILGAVSTVLTGGVTIAQGYERGDWYLVSAGSLEIASGILSGIAILTGASGLEPVAITAQILATIVTLADDTPAHHARDLCWALADSLTRGSNARICHAVGFGDVDGLKATISRAEWFTLDAANFGPEARGDTHEAHVVRYEVNRIMRDRLMAIGIPRDTAANLMFGYGNPEPDHPHDMTG